MFKKVNSSSLKFNIVMSIIAQLFCYFTPIIVAPYISRVLQPEGIGVYSYSYSYVFYFSSVLLLGFSNLGINLISKNRNDKNIYSSIFWTIFLIRFLLGVFVILLYIGFTFYSVNYLGMDYKIMFALLIVLFGNILDIKFLYQGLENFKIVTIFQVLINIFYVISIFTFVRNSNDVLTYTILKSSIDVCVNLFLIFFVFKVLNKPCILKDQILKILKGSLILFVPSILLNLGMQVDQTLLGIFSTSEQVGFFQQALKFPLLIGNLTYALSPVMLSRVSFLTNKNDINEIKDKVTKIFVMSFFFSIPCGFGLYAIGDIFVPIYFGSEFMPVVNLLYITIPICLFSPLSTVIINSYLYPTGQTKKVVFSACFDLFSNFLIGILLLSLTNMEAYGVAISTLLAEFILFVLLLANCVKILNKKIAIFDFLKVLISSAIFLIVIKLFNFYVAYNLHSIIVLVIDVLIGVIIFVVSNLLLKEMILIQIKNTIFDLAKSILRKK